MLLHEPFQKMYCLAVSESEREGIIQERSQQVILLIII